MNTLWLFFFATFKFSANCARVCVDFFFRRRRIATQLINVIFINLNMLLQRCHCHRCCCCCCCWYRMRICYLENLNTNSTSKATHPPQSAFSVFFVLFFQKSNWMLRKLQRSIIWIYRSIWQYRSVFVCWCVCVHKLYITYWNSDWLQKQQHLFLRVLVLSVQRVFFRHTHWSDVNASRVNVQLDLFSFRLIILMCMPCHAVCAYFMLIGAVY